MNVKFKKLIAEAVIPTRKTEGAIGYDLTVPCDTVVDGRCIIPLGLSVEMPNNLEAKIEPRSGFSARGITGVNAPCGTTEESYDADVLVGKIDPDYRGEIGVIIRSNSRFIVKAGTRIAQMTFYKVETPDIEVVESLSESERGEGGFGSTGAV